MSETMKMEDEIHELLDKANDECDENESRNQSKRYSMTYEEGVRNTLQWLLGEFEDDETPFD